MVQLYSYWGVDFHSVWCLGKDAVILRNTVIVIAAQAGMSRFFSIL
jgi:hypothetical protein